MATAFGGGRAASGVVRDVGAMEIERMGDSVGMGTAGAAGAGGWRAGLWLVRPGAGPAGC